MFVVFLVEGNNVDRVYGPYNEYYDYINKAKKLLLEYDVEYCGIVERALHFDGDYLITDRNGPVEQSVRLCIRDVIKND